MKQREGLEGIFTAVGRAVDESLVVASAMRAGKLTRHQFGAWYAKRRAEGAVVADTLREKASRMAEPVEAAFAQGEELLRTVAPREPRRSVGQQARRRQMLRTASRRAATIAANRAKAK